MSTPGECNADGFSQTACGFVLEFVEIVSPHAYQENNHYVGWSLSDIR